MWRLLTLPVLVLLAGCTGGGDAASNVPEGSGPQTAAEAQKSSQDRVAEIQNNPNMPPAEKERAMAAFRTNPGNAPKKP